MRLVVLCLVYSLVYSGCGKKKRSEKTDPIFEGEWASVVFYYIADNRVGSRDGMGFMTESEV